MVFSKRVHVASSIGSFKRRVVFIRFHSKQTLKTGKSRENYFEGKEEPKAFAYDMQLLKRTIAEREKELATIQAKPARA
jgi:hypothetical protein